MPARSAPCWADLLLCVHDADAVASPRRGTSKSGGFLSSPFPPEALRTKFAGNDLPDTGEEIYPRKYLDITLKKCKHKFGCMHGNSVIE